MLTFGVMLLVGIVDLGLTERVRMQAEAARARAADGDPLLAEPRAGAASPQAEHRHERRSPRRRARRGTRVVVLVAGADDSLTPLQGTDVRASSRDPLEQAAARQALERGPAGAGTDTAVVRQRSTCRFGGPVARSVSSA